jgi:glycosyltransferase involved in cell wall biosynthesis
MTTVCHLSSVHRGLDIRIYHKQCVSLAQAGFEVYLVIGATTAEVAEAARAGVTVVPLDGLADAGRLHRMLVRSWRCYRLARAVEADVYHLHDPELIPYGLLLNWQGKKVILDLHEDLRGDIHAKHWIPGPLRHALGKLMRGLEHFAARRVAAVVVATPHIGTLFEHSATRLAVVRNFPVIGELAGAPLPARQERDCVCYAGAINESRGIRQTIRALAMAPCKLLLAGRFDSPELREELRAYPGWRQVEECGFVDRGDVAKIMARSFCGLVTLHPEPNYIQSLPIKLFEYMSAGVPVIASDFPLWRQIIDEAGCGLCVDPGNPDEIARAINYLRTHPAQVEQMGDNGRRAVASLYRWDREAARLVALYSRIQSTASSA